LMRRLIRRLRTEQLAVRLHARRGDPVEGTLPIPVDSLGAPEGTSPAVSEAEGPRPVEKSDPEASDGPRRVP
jgi:hypothetical protein